MLETKFFTSNQYLALARGALAFMNVPGNHIDYLVAGLPLNIYRTEAILAHVSKQLSGPHTVPDVRSGGDAERQITVRKVKIVPQVVGSLIAMSRDAGLMEKIQNQRNLTIDVGYGTLLWLATQGFSPLPARSGGSMGGVSNILQRLARAMHPSSESNIAILDRLDIALLEGAPPSSLLAGNSPSKTSRIICTAALRCLPEFAQFNLWTANFF